MSKAEYLAKELYPDWKMTGVPTVDGQEESMVRIQRVAYIKGYHQAEQDLTLTWEDLKMIDEISDQVYAECDVDAFDEKEYYQEVLKRFKDYKERKEK